MDRDEIKRHLDVARFKTEELLCSFVDDIQNLIHTYNNVRKSYLTTVYVENKIDELDINNIKELDNGSIIDYKAYVYGLALNIENTNLIGNSDNIKENIQEVITKLDNIFNSVNAFEYEINPAVDYKLVNEDLENKDLVKIAKHIKLCDYSDIKGIEIIDTKWKRDWNDYEERETLTIYKHNDYNNSEYYNNANYYRGEQFTGVIVYREGEQYLLVLNNQLAS